MRKTLGNGLEQLCETVLTPIFGQGDVEHKVQKSKPHQRLHSLLSLDSSLFAPQYETITG
jgi:hypothetical protein